MSGRDMKSFLTRHRPDETSTLVKRVSEGLYSAKYRPVDYDKLKATAAQKQFSGQEALVKVKKLQQLSKQGKDQNLIKQHKAVWQREFLRLNSLRRKLQAEIDLHTRTNTDAAVSKQLYQDFDDYESALSADFLSFKFNTADPIWTLREDLQYWIEEHKMGRSSDNIVEQDPRKVLETVQGVKAQQTLILDKLRHEQVSLERDLQIGDLPDCSAPSLDKKIQTGIPEEAFDLDCPSLDLKASVLQEFIFLDQKFVEKLEEMEEQHSTAISSATGGWSAEDHFTFLYVLEQYTYDLQNRRLLYIDRLRRHLPHMARADIVGHEEWWTLNRYYNERRKDLITDWLRDRRELLNRAKMIFAEACAAQEKREQKAEHQERQAELCNALYEQVREWREQKLEAMQLEQALLERRRQERAREREQEDERERQRRQVQKDKVKQYKDETSSKKREEDEAARRRLEELKKTLAEQAERDKQRVRYRDEQVQAKLEQQQRKRQDDQDAQEERDRVLEAIRSQVRPHVEADLLRMWSETEAWKARQKSDLEPNLQRPLFNVNTFTATQITADPRVKLEHALREAGIHQNAYAREVLSHVQPLHPQRRDMESSVFRQT